MALFLASELRVVAAVGPLLGGRVRLAGRWFQRGTYWPLVDVGAALGLGAVALAVRLPRLLDVPSLTDEANEVMRALAIARGELFPLTNVASYLSAAFNYALAGLFLVFGFSPELPRWLMLATGVLTVMLVYFLARDLASACFKPPAPGSARAAGVAAGLLMAVNGGHALVNSHVSWAHSTTPLFATVTFWLAHRAIWLGQRRTLLLAAAALGVTIQSHTTAVALSPGLALAALVGRGPRFWGWRVLLAGPVLVALLLTNIVVYAATTGGESVSRALNASEAYARGIAPSLDLYLPNLARLGIGLARLTGGAVDVRAGAADYLLDPVVLLAAGLALVGALLLARRGNLLALGIALPYALLFGYFNPKYQVVPNARYLTPLLPLVFSALAIALIWLGRRLPWPRPTWAVVGVGALCVVLLAGALHSFQRRLDQLEPSIEASRELALAVAALFEAGWDGEPVGIDPDLEKLWLDGGGDFRMALHYHLAIRGVSARDFETRPNREQGAIDTCRRNRIELRRVEPALSPEAPRLIRDDPTTAEDESLRPYWLYRSVQPRDQARDQRRGQGDEWSMVVASYAPPLAASARAVDRCAPGRFI